jgi:hypothetical protein
MIGRCKMSVGAYLGEVICFRRRMAACRRVEVVTEVVGDVWSPTEMEVQMKEQVNLGRSCCTAA